MTTQSGEGGKKAASPNDTHLISNNIPYEHSTMWCGAEFVPSTETLAETTCLLCLKAAKIYGEGAATRLQHLEESKQPPDRSDYACDYCGIKYPCWQPNDPDEGITCTGCHVGHIVASQIVTHYLEASK